ncbi:low temperature requirement protein A [Kribbella kalugense]|uniref:Low temperature requirement protein LtrA n=1 Tax=Kribbella kalugense TaxID=2512221 RepID=A0A4R8A068_9ACTN|nr:low temperature requirement protein A [Kribbella kalugense]TDW23525.1 low temperature requirement protein LtrA [Kribbella kalugense]
MVGTRRPIRAVETSADQSVTTLELFFDLVFVFALTQITALMAHDLSWHGVVRGAFLLGLLWWSWAAYSWVCNIAKADEGSVRTVLLCAMAAMFVIALAIPEAFDDLPGGLPGPVVIALAYFVLRAMHLVLLWLIAEGDRVLRRTIGLFTIGKVAATALLLVASQYHGTTQTLLWAGALASDYVVTYLVDARGWRFNSPSHWAERHGLIIIIALGESIVAIGVGVTDLPISWPILVASLLGLGVCTALWWIYFDATVHYGERALAEEPPETRPWLARDAYTFLHVPMVAGIVLLALGLKKVLEYVGDAEHHRLSQPLHGVGLFALFFGVVLYLLGHVGFKRRTIHRWSVSRLTAAGLLVVAVPLVHGLPALAQLTALAVVLAGLVAFESFRFAGEREDLRHSEDPAETA